MPRNSRSAGVDPTALTATAASIPRLYARSRSLQPSQRYGAALAYGPLLRVDPKLRPMQESVMQYAFCSPGSLRSDSASRRTRGTTVHVHADRQSTSDGSRTQLGGPLP